MTDTIDTLEEATTAIGLPAWWETLGHTSITSAGVHDARGRGESPNSRNLRKLRRCGHSAHRLAWHLAASADVQKVWGYAGREPWPYVAHESRANVTVMTEEKSKNERAFRVTLDSAVENVMFWGFVSVAVVTCGWAPNCGGHSGDAPPGDVQGQSR